VPSYLEVSAGSFALPGDKEKGTVVFTRACVACHGIQGRGIVQATETVNTINDRVFLGLISNQALRRYVITGLPDRGMPSFAGTRPGNEHFVPLSDQDVADLVALLSSWRNDK
jgi:mono/diheme cytochrome c family protein